VTDGRGAQQAPGGQGQALVEFALVIPVFVLALVGLFDVGRLVYTNSVLSQAAREAARLGAAQADWVGVTAPSCGTEAEIGAGRPGAHVCPESPAALRDNVSAAANRMVVGLGALTAVHVSCNEADAAPSGDWVMGPSGGNGCEDSDGSPVGTAGDLLSVRIEYTYDPITPIVSTLIGSVPLSGAATMVVN
jgi:hypothetical protein